MEEGQPSTRYGESRILVRGVCRLPGQSREEFRQNVLRLRRHFEQFNVDASEVCQWLMGLRPGGKRGSDATKTFWDFFLEPETLLDGGDRGRGDGLRRRAFDLAAGCGDAEILSGSIPSHVLESTRAVAKLPLTPSAEKLFERLRNYEDGHRAVLLKAAAEWIVAHYWRGMKNWERQREEWEKEKIQWEEGHPELTEEARKEFNTIFRDLGIKDKRARVCAWERLKGLKDDCEYAGERVGKKNHAPLCAKYKKFFGEYKRKPEVGKNFKKFFVQNAGKYLENKKTGRQLTFQEQLRQKWFPGAWKAYLAAIGVDEKTILNKYNGRLPHCTEFGDDEECEYNKHTEPCNLYRGRLADRPDLQGLEKIYREWRRLYLAGPSKPSFKYPSSRDLPMPKIFGKGFYRADFGSSALGLRLEGMAKGEFLSFGFKPWPKDYSPQPGETEITSVHINFVGTRARAGLRFETPHRGSRFAMSQDEIDELRSRAYPRQAQDGEFLNAARGRLLKSFGGDPDRDLRLLAVDLGETGACAAFYEGKVFKGASPLKIVKLDKLYDALPKPDNKGQKSEEEKDRDRKKGLRKAHVGRHLESFSKEAAEIAQKTPKSPELAKHDLRRLSLHVRWMIRDWVRLNASQIIKAAEEKKADLIVLESMRGFKAPGYDKLNDEKKRRMAFFAYGRIRQKVKEKAVERGMRVVTVPYLKSSQFCAECGKEQDDKNTWEKNKKKRMFVCEYCKQERNSDENAARVLARVFWGEIGLPVVPST